MDNRYEQDDILEINSLIGGYGEVHSFVLFIDGAAYCSHQNLDLNLNVVFLPIEINLN